MSHSRALEVLLFGKAGFIGSFVFRTPKVTIGRAQDAMVRLDDSSVSLNHAILTLEGGLFRIKDNGSRTGTRVNGAPILPRQPVEPTDELSIGPFRLRVTLCDPDLDDEPTHANDAASNRISSLLADISKPTAAEPFFPPFAGSMNGGRSGSEAPARHARADRYPEPPPHREAALDDSGSSPTLVARSSSERPPSIEPASTRPQPREARTPAAPAPRADFFQDLFGPPQAAPAKPSPSKKSERPRPPPPQEAEVAPAISERPPVAKGFSADTQEVGPAAFAFAVHDAEAGQRERHVDDDDEDEDESNFVPAFDLVNELLAAGLDEDSAGGRSLLLEVVHSRDDRVRSIHHPRVRGPLRVPGLKEILGTIEPDGSVSLLRDACPGLTVKERNRSVAPASLTDPTSNKITFVVGMQARCDLPSGNRVLLHWVSKANAVQLPPLQLRPSREGMRSGSASFAFHIAIALFIGLVALGEERPAADINAGRFATINTKELELEPPPPPPPPQKDEPVVDNAPTIEMPTNPHDVSKKNAKVVKGATVHSTSEAPPSNTPSASTQKILSSLGGATSSASAISVTNLDALPSGVGGDFKVSGALGKAPSDSLRVASGSGNGKDVDTKTVSELGANKMGRVQGATGTGTVRARVTAAPQAIRGEGHLDRGEIQKVVNAHLYQVQGCYERQLAKDPSLSGKVSYDWDVGLTGGVSNVRVGRSSIHSVEVTTCIQSAIQGWHFPTPQGGTVTVTYPFAFSALGG